ncbi:MAG: nucleoid-structuring protein H-NS [Candidatus Nitronauta litoralis]|uniref:Nucleoid-structuring protein H-NS n=1 Tax=Candidatus Nitronauta litoralis TaxID=2705533 RepID=A0A7T0G197_9BACT|nr:MAG: nucleoid-structuring protein H-NS [Candidatus Nitronauta litoralis]
MYRPEIKVLDCTIRDGGLMNDHQFSPELVRNVYKAASEAGIDYVELGYKADESQFDRSKFGAMKFCKEEDLKDAIIGVENGAKLSVMVDIGRVDPEDIPPKSESVVTMMRVASYVKDIDKAIDLVNQIHDKGYETTVNVMAVSHARERELDEALIQLEKECATDVVYLVDSFGALYSEQIAYMAKKYKSLMPSKEIGIHAHNNQQLAFANTIEAIINNINYLDATIFGIGRAAGNCPMELLLGFLKNPKFDLSPVLELIGSDFLKMQKEIEWGYTIPYAVTGILDLHPRAGMAHLKTEERDDFRSFYEKLLNEANV